MLYDVLLKASAECSSLKAVCADLEDVAVSNTQRAYINLALPIQELASQAAQANQALAGCIPESMVRTGVEVAIDFMMSRSMASKKICERSPVAGKPRKAPPILCASPPPM
jgi:hypothetical protein